MLEKPSLEKPKFGEPCNGCGLCCLSIPCPIARDLIGAFEAPCPALEIDEGRYWCGIIRNPSKHIYGLGQKPWSDQTIREMLLSSGMWGCGCDSSDQVVKD